MEADATLAVPTALPGDTTTENIIATAEAAEEEPPTIRPRPHELPPSITVGTKSFSTGRRVGTMSGYRVMLGTSDMDLRQSDPAVESLGPSMPNRTEPTRSRCP